jgi:hypothetical protein
MTAGEKTIGVLGAYGHVGSNAVRELARMGRFRLLLGGRKQERLDEVRAVLNGRPAATQAVDVHDARSVAEFCRQCDIVVNCSRYGDTLARAVLDAGCHLVDTTAFRTERWTAEEARLRERQQAWITYVGWIPGLPEVVLAYLEAEATRRFGRASSVDVYAYDCNEYLGYGLMDLVGGLFYGPGVLDKVHGLFGKKQPNGVKPPPEQELDRIRPTPKLRVAKLPSPVGRKLVVTNSTDQKRRIFLAYEPALLKPLLASFWYGTTRSEEWLAQNVVGPAFRRRVEKHGVAEVVFGRACGEAGQTIEVSYVETERDGYWLSGVIPALAARLVADGKVTNFGITKLDRAVDAFTLAQELSDVGVDFRVKA